MNENDFFVRILLKYNFIWLYVFLLFIFLFGFFCLLCCVVETQTECVYYCIGRQKKTANKHTNTNTHTQVKHVLKLNSCTLYVESSSFYIYNRQNMHASEKWRCVCACVREKGKEISFLVWMMMKSSYINFIKKMFCNVELIFYKPWTEELCIFIIAQIENLNKTKTKNKSHFSQGWCPSIIKKFYTEKKWICFFCLL